MTVLGYTINPVKVLNSALIIWLIIDIYLISTAMRKLTDKVEKLEKDLQDIKPPDGNHHVYADDCGEFVIRRRTVDKQG